MTPGGHLGFLVLLADSLGLYLPRYTRSLTIRPEETLCTALIFLHRYQRWNETLQEKEMILDPHVLVQP